jgi:heme exporter protein A
MSPSASLHDATVVLDDRAVLRRVTFEVLSGLTLVRGPNGAGKTTLLRALAGLVPLARGRREVDGAPLFLGHRPMLLRGLSPRANLTFLAAFRGRPVHGVADALRRWGLEGVADRPMDRLSAGQRKRAALARMDTEPEQVVLLDEPFADLDADGAGRLRESVRAARLRGQDVVLVTHLSDELDGDASRRFIIEAGQVRPA